MPTERILRACTILVVLAAIALLGAMSSRARGWSAHDLLPASYRTSGVR